MEFSILKLTTNTSDDIWKRYFELRKECVEKLNDYMSFNTWEELKEKNTHFISTGEGIYIIQQKENFIGYFYFFLQEKGNPDLRYILFQSKIIGEILNDALLQLVFKEAYLFDPLSKSIAIRSINKEHDSITKKISPSIICTRELFELKIKESNIKKINNWLEESPKKFNNFSIQFYDELPDELLLEYCKVFRELLLDMPDNSELGSLNITAEEEKERQENGKKINNFAYKHLIFNENNKLIAMTNVLVNKNNPKQASQFMTGVLKEYRGLGLSKWLKAAMYKKLTDDFPSLEKIHTETHPENHASRELSKQMGYIKTGIEKDFLLTIKSTKDFIENQKQ